MAEEKPTVETLMEQMRSVELLIELAKDGDSYAAGRLLADFVLRHDLGKQPKPILIEWLCDCFSEVILGNKTADVALGLKPGKGKRGGQKKNIQDLYQEAVMAELG